jgi:hypothetical protein
MGYSEIVCQICSVSFNISRFRTEHEPASATWRNTGDGVEPYPATDDFVLEDFKCITDGCYFIRRTGDERDESPASHPQRWPQPGSIYLTKTIDDLEADEADEEIDEEVPIGGGEDGRWEHIAGPRCQSTNAYNGCNISVEAMRGCNTAQCLVPKEEDWTPEPDDQPFEVSGKYFLSGLTDLMSSRDTGYSTYFPSRHGAEDSFVVDNYLFSGSEDELSMPFHPTCLEIFKRASLWRYGAVDVDALTGWWRQEWHWEPFHSFPRHENLSHAREQWWQHYGGDEFFAANPCFVPELETVLSSSKLSKPARDEPGSESGAATSARPDVFFKLPLEVRCIIASHTSISDLAHLRQAFDSFKALPQSLYFEILTQQKPWLYEAWCSMPLSRWTTTSEAKLREGDRPEDLPMEPLSRNETDWKYLATELVRLETEVPGLKNRSRIWTDCQEIMNRADAYRKKGKI